MFVWRGEKKSPQQKEFCDFKKDLSNNMFNENLLWAYHNKLVFHLQNIFEIDKSATCYCFFGWPILLPWQKLVHEEDMECLPKWKYRLQWKIKNGRSKKKLLGPFPQKNKKMYIYLCDYWLIFVKYNLKKYTTYLI